MESPKAADVHPHFRWLGAAGIDLQVNGQILAIDPFFTRPPLRSLWFGKAQPDQAMIEKWIRKYDYILISHPHYDHLMDVPVVLEKTGALALGSENACRIMRLLGAADKQVRRIETGDRITLGQFQVEAIASRHIRLPGFGPGPLKEGLHPPLRLRDYRMDSSFSFLILAGARRLLVWTSALTEPAPQADVLFLSLTGTRAYLKDLLSKVQPGVVVPTHWDDFFRPLSRPIRPSFEPPRLAIPPVRRKDMDAFRSTIGEIAPGAKTIIPEIFHSYPLTGCDPGGCNPEGREA